MSPGNGTLCHDGPGKSTTLHEGMAVPKLKKIVLVPYYLRKTEESVFTPGA